MYLDPSTSRFPELRAGLLRPSFRPSVPAALHTAAEQHPEELCFCSSDMRLKVREQMPHWYFFTSAWVCRWARRLERSAKARLQWGQENGRSPEQVREKAQVT